MKVLAIACLSAALAAAEDGSLDGEVWYDADGRIAYVDGPAAKPAPRRLVPEWERREKERAERPTTWRFQNRGHQGWYGYRGWSVVRPCVPRPSPRWCAGPYPGKSRIIIRRSVD